MVDVKFEELIKYIGKCLRIENHEKMVTYVKVEKIEKCPIIPCEYIASITGPAFTFYTDENKNAYIRTVNKYWTTLVENDRIEEVTEGEFIEVLNKKVFSAKVNLIKIIRNNNGKTGSTSED